MRPRFHLPDPLIDGRLLAGARERLVALLASAIALSAPPAAHAAGLLDLSFGVRGTVHTEAGTFLDATAHAIVAQPDGKLVVLVESYRTPRECFALQRYAADGTIDWAFGIGGLALTCFDAGSDSRPRSLVLQADGKLVAAGSQFGGGGLVVARYDSAGGLDTDFGAGGSVKSVDVGLPAAEAGAVVIQPVDGKIVVGGGSGEPGFDFALVRYDSTGALDASFGTGGKVVTDLGAVEYLTALALQPDGKIVAAGYSLLPPSSSSFAIVRYDTLGQLDPSFGSGGVVFAGSTYAFDVAVQPDGKIVVAGTSESGITIVRTDEHGVADPGFGFAGRVTTPLSPFPIFDSANAVEVQPDGKILVAGVSHRERYDDATLVRYESDGQLDATFGTGGVVFTSPGPADDRANAMLLTADGRIAVAGAGMSATPGRGRADAIVLRYVGIHCGDTDPTDPGEECDDGNGIDGDGCDTNCTVSACGNRIHAGAEQCDDGNELSGDGCQSDCTIAGLGGGACDPAECGDGTFNAFCEFCDDQGPGDDCDSRCQLERNFEDVALAAGEPLPTTTDPGGASTAYPIELELTAGEPGLYSVKITSRTDEAEAFALFGKEIVIEGPEAPSTPHSIRLMIEGNLVEPGVDDAIQILRNGAALRPCAESSPPCIASRAPNEETGDYDVVILAREFSDWGYGLLDRDRDGRADDVDECSVVSSGQEPAKTKLSVGQLERGPGTQKLKWSGSFRPTAGATVAPDLRGAHVRIADAGSTLLDVSIPPGTAFGPGLCDPRDGWKANGARTSFTYRNVSGFLDGACAIPSRGLSKVVIKDRRALAPADVQFTIDAKGGTFPAATPPVRLQANLSLSALAPRGGASVDAIAGRCAESVWGPRGLGDAMPAVCTVKSKRGTPSLLTCSRG